MMVVHDFYTVIARQYELEKEMGVLENRESVSEHRIADLERKEK
ncbi:MAG: hypothetical protein PUF08_04620 [Clostridiales bacterium]|nr:hypothetical protein [Clostridiales bacterium]